MPSLFKKLIPHSHYLKKHKVNQLRAAYEFANEAHKGQKRHTGEDYIIHPVEVTVILAKWHMDFPTLTAGLLHDVLEDTPVDKLTLIKKFGRSVAQLVDSVSKLTQMTFESRTEAQAENFRKMLLAMSKDVRVILIKLADRLHNMRTLSTLPAEKRCRIARETLEIYAPIARRLGMREVSTELESLGFRCLYPQRFLVLSTAVNRVHGSRTPILREIDYALNKKLSKAGISGYKIQGRQKHLYSIYKKMRDKDVPFTEITDVYAVRIITNDTDTCYRVLGLVHNLYKPIPERFKDYIALPKNNGYQSLHTTLFGPYGVPIEIQIRTHQMDEMANTGIAAHWLYKTGNKRINEPQILAQQWVKNLLEIQRATGSPLEFIENVKIDLFPDEVYVFTPKGGILELPMGSTPIDFAYAVHTAVGNTCVAARIDRQLAPLTAMLSNGQTVEIITSPNARPNPIWLNSVVTAKARTSIRHYLKNQQREESIALGRKLLNRDLGVLRLSLKRLPKSVIEQVLAKIKVKTLEDLLADIGLGNRVSVLTVQRIIRTMKRSADVLKEEQATTTQIDEAVPLLIKGTEGMVVSFGECCCPIPGDSIMGVISKGKGIIVHLEQCYHISKLRRVPNRCVSVRWREDVKGSFVVPLRVEIVNKQGVLAELASEIADTKANIEDIQVLERDGHNCILRIKLLVKSRQHLANVLRATRRISSLIRISRISR